MRKTVRLGLLALAVLAAVVLGRALTFRSVQKQVPPAPAYPVDAAKVAAHLAAAVRIATVSEASLRDPESFARLEALLRGLYPRAFATLQVKRFDDTLLLTWPGADVKLPAALFLAHQDVVPVEPGTESAWTHPPFAGEIADGYVWGRGTMDDKASLVAQFEALEALLETGHAPRRTLHFGFGHDEEVRGSGAQSIAHAFAKTGQSLALVLDEGLALTRGIVPGVAAPVALVGVAEKGFLTVEVASSTTGGHSSTPPARSAIGRVARAVDRLESTPTPASFDGVPGAFLDAVGPEMSFGLKLVMANRWLFSPVVLRIYDQKPTTRASVRTSVAPTMLRAGVKDNVLAREATATVNFRVRPGETAQSTLAWAEATIGDGEVRLAPLEGSISSEPSPATPVDSWGYRRVEATLRAVYPEAVVAPSLVLGATDARHFARQADAVLRFAPLQLTSEEVLRLHGVDERVKVEDLALMVRFYRQLFLDVDAP